MKKSLTLCTAIVAIAPIVLFSYASAAELNLDSGFGQGGMINFPGISKVVSTEKQLGYFVVSNDSSRYRLTKLTHAGRPANDFGSSGVVNMDERFTTQHIEKVTALTHDSLLITWNGGEEWNWRQHVTKLHWQSGKIEEAFSTLLSAALQNERIQYTKFGTFQSIWNRLKGGALNDLFHSWITFDGQLTFVHVEENGVLRQDRSACQLPFTATRTWRGQEDGTFYVLFEEEYPAPSKYVRQYEIKTCQPNLTYGKNGQIGLVYVESHPDDKFEDVVVYPDGRVAYALSLKYRRQLRIHRLLATGEPDLSFGRSGVMESVEFGKYSYSWFMPDLKLETTLKNGLFISGIRAVNSYGGGHPFAYFVTEKGQPFKGDRIDEPGMYTFPITAPHWTEHPVIKNQPEFAYKSFLGVWGYETGAPGTTYLSQYEIIEE